MKNLIFTLGLLFGIGISANADGGIYLNPLLSQANNLQLSSIKSLNNFPDYTCKVRVKLSLTYVAGISGECEGGGTSKSSANEACDQAYEALSACMQRAANYGFYRDTPRPIEPLSRYGEW